LVQPRPIVRPFALVVLAVAGSCHLAPAQTPGGLSVRVVESAAGVAVLCGERSVLDYCHVGDPWKPHLAQLCTPGGVPVLRVSPPDHVHHRGLIFALGVDDFDFWGEHYVAKPGRQLGAAVTDLSAGSNGDRGAAGFAQAIEWRAGEPEQVLVQERRRLDVDLGPDLGATLLTWSSELRLPAGRAPAKLWGRHYFGLGARFVAAMDRSGRFQTPDGKLGEVVRGDERLTRAEWCAYIADCGGQTVTVAMFGHPDNLRSPTVWFTMKEPFAYLAATLDLEREPLELSADKPLRLRHGVAVLDGAVSTERLAALQQTWLLRCRERDAAAARASATDAKEPPQVRRNP
jgi:hypothetical protein